MKLTIDDDGFASFDIFELLHDIPAERIPELIESLSCREEIIQHVCTQIVYGCTDNGYSGWCSSSGDTATQKARLHVAKNSSEVAERVIRGLQADVKRNSDLYEEFSKKYYDLLHPDRGVL